MNITKILLSIIIGVAVATSADAANTMCVTSDNNSIILDPTIDGTALVSSEVEKTWSATFSYGTLSGEARCTNIDGEYKQVATVAQNRQIENFPVGVTPANEDYKACWCRVLSPVRSFWVCQRGFYGESGSNVSAQNCAQNCAVRCGNLMKGYPQWRDVVFGNLGM